MPGESFVRPRDQFRFLMGGMKLNAPADSLPPNKYALAINVRSVDDGTVVTRPGQVRQFITGGFAATDLNTYATLNTNNAVRVLVRDVADQIWLDNGVQVGTLFPGTTGAANPPGVSMIPFRPNQSPNPYMYIANGQDYQKFSAPDVANAVVASQVGIAEPQDPAEAVTTPPVASVKPIPLGSWTLGGLATTLTTAHRVVDTVRSAFLDPRQFQYTLGVDNTTIFQRGMVVNIGATGEKFWVEDVYSSLPDAISVLSVYYFVGTTDRCVIVLQNLTADRGSSASLYTPEVVASLRRGAIIQWGGGGVNEITYILSVTTGPDGSLSVETSTPSNHIAGETITILPAIQVEQLAGTVSPSTGDIIGEEEISYVIPTPGVGYVTAPVTGLFTSKGLAFQPDDYFSFAVICNDPTQLIEAKILFDVNDGSFNSDYYYYTVRASDLTNAIANVDTQLAAIQTVVQRAIIDEETGATANSQGVTFSSTQASPGPAQWTQILIPISMLTRVGSDESLTLQNTNSVRILWNVLGAVSVANDYTIAVWGGSQPDVGDAGIPYKYRIRPRSSVTGVKGNPSPAMRYGVSPRRQSVNVKVPGVTSDPQWDTNDVFRYGGSLTSWRFIGSQRLSISHTIFVDNFDDAAATAGEELEFDNFEPWPSIDFPLNAQTLSVTGTTAIVTIPAPTNALRFLPGNLILLGGQNAYTLWTRPMLVAGTTDQYLFQFVENAGALNSVPVIIYEPALARQFLPYMWGTDDAGTLFACGDPLRPGTIYFSKNNAPDAAPDSYNIEIVQPSEPLQGGEILDGRSFVASTERWWALYPQPSNPVERYNPVLQPFPRGLAAPFGHCNDGRAIYWWAKDGIWSSAKGSLTDGDLYNLFPHEGVPGAEITYGTPPVGRTIFPPDYTQAGSFRLTYSNYYLYATYKDTTGAYETLVYDTRRDAWCLDQYGVPVTVFCHPDQTQDELLMANIGGEVLVQTLLSNDNVIPIDALLATMEFDGGDTRAPKQWGDLYLDCIPAAPDGLILNPTSYSAPITAPLAVPTGNARVQLPINLGGIVVASTFGIVIQWTDNYIENRVVTKLFVWQPSLTIQPASTIAWQTFGASFGLMGYGHIREIALAYVSTAPITLTIASVDGQSPADVIFPSSAGRYTKLLLPLTANKGQMFNFKVLSDNPFQLFLDDTEVRVGGWSRQDNYMILKTFGGSGVSSAPL